MTQNDNKVVEMYGLAAQNSSQAFQEDYLTFCPFQERIPGFSMSRVLLNPDKYPTEMALIRAKQIELRQVLFYSEDFGRIQSLFDIGCGLGTDVIQIACLYPHINTHGYTITIDQANIGNKRITEMNVSHRAKIFHRDSSRYSYPGSYDLIIGIEVTFHIRDKHALFNNIAIALQEQGRVLLMDYISNIGKIFDPLIETSISTEQEWVELLSYYKLAIYEIVDVSPEIANYLYDPEVEFNTKHLPLAGRDLLLRCAGQANMLDQGQLEYCLIKLEKRTHWSYMQIRNHNEAKIRYKTPYPEALIKTLEIEHVLYPPTPK